MEWGKWTGIGSTWTSKSFKQSYTNPRIVISGAYSYAATTGEYSVIAEVRNVTSTGCEVRLRIPPHDAQTGWSEPSSIEIYYIVAEDTGTATDYVIPGTSLKVQVGSYSTTTCDSNSSWSTGETVPYYPAFSGTISVFHTRVTHNDSRFAHSWCCRSGARSSPPNYSDTGCKIGFTQDEVEPADNFSTAETLHYIIVETGTGTIPGANGSYFQITCGRDTGSPGIGNTISFDITGTLSGFSETPLVAVMAMEEMDGGNGGWGLLRGSESWTATTIYGVVVEDQDADTERNHISETFGVWVFATDGQYPESEGESQDTAAGLNIRARADPENSAKLRRMP